jgi:hypothetical protein
MISIGTLFPGRSFLDYPKTHFDAPDRLYAPGLFLLPQPPRTTACAFVLSKGSRHCANDRPPKSFQTLRCPFGRRHDLAPRRRCGGAVKGSGDIAANSGRNLPNSNNSMCNYCA